MINQTDWMGQIWFVIAQSGRGSEREMDYSVLCEDVCVGVFVDVSHLCACVFVCEGADVCMKGAEVKLLCV